MRSIVRYGAVILLAAAFLPRFEFTRGMRAAQSAATQQRAPAPQPVLDPDGQVIRSERQSFRIEVLARGVETPWGLAFLPDGRLLITERPGRLRILAGGKLLSEAVAGTPAVWERQDGGLFDVEVHPRYAENGWIYLSYSEPGPNETSMTAIVRGRLRNGRWVDQQFIFHAPPELYTASNIHYGSRFLFDKQGRLFYSIGDRGKIDDAQDLSKPAGKVHRVQNDGSALKDNPFANRPGALPSIWTYGHRNPQGLAFDAAGRMWESEHGPRGGDELNRLAPGRNYGWGVISHGIQEGITKTAQEGMEQPIVHWTPAIGPSSIVFYSGNRYPQWRNHLFVSALGGQQLRRLEVVGDSVTHQEAVFTQFGRVRDLTVGPDGYFYVALQIPGARLSDSTQGFVVRLMPVP